jgi:SAM-dependent methyltransferase
LTTHPALDAPSAWVSRWLALAPPSGRALDVAAGSGRHARLLAARGLDVVAVDRDAGALASLSGVPRVTVCVSDLEGTAWPFEPASFDVVVVVNYLHRPLFPPLSAALRPSGLLIYETFMVGNERYGRPSNPDFLLRPGELIEAFSSVLGVLGFEQGVVAAPKRSVVQRLAARRGDPGVTALPETHAAGAVG